MTTPLLSTKFHAPPIGSYLVRRQRLWRILDDGLEQKASLILIWGPAGYGKTTLVSEWLQASQKVRTDQFAWLTLERGDDYLTLFLTYFVTALQRLRSGFGDGILKILQTHKPPPVTVLATLLINELDELPGRIFLVLDDYHLITAESIQVFLAFLVDHQPKQLCLVLLTRTDPPLPLPRLRARRQLVELRQEALCFLPEEVDEFAKRVMGFVLSPEQLAFLGKRTEGWISGLQLAAISMRSAPDLSTFFKAFSGEDRFITDYLTEDVLSGLSESLRTFLLQAMLAILQARTADAIRLSEQALRLLPAERTFFRSLAADRLGMAFTLAGEIDHAASSFEQVVEISTQSGNIMMTLMALTNLAGLHYVQGYMRLADLIEGNLTKLLYAHPFTFSGYARPMFVDRVLNHAAGPVIGVLVPLLIFILLWKRRSVALLPLVMVFPWAAMETGANVIQIAQTGDYHNIIRLTGLSEAVIVIPCLVLFVIGVFFFLSLMPLLGMSPKDWRVLFVLPAALILWGGVSIVVARLVVPGSPIDVIYHEGTTVIQSAQTSQLGLLLVLLLVLLYLSLYRVIYPRIPSWLRSETVLLTWKELRIPALSAAACVIVGLILIH